MKTATVVYGTCKECKSEVAFSLPEDVKVEDFKEKFVDGPCPTSQCPGGGLQHALFPPDKTMGYFFEFTDPPKSKVTEVRENKDVIQEILANGEKYSYKIYQMGVSGSDLPDFNGLKLDHVGHGDFKSTDGKHYYRRNDLPEGGRIYEEMPA